MKKYFSLSHTVSCILLGGALCAALCGPPAVSAEEEVANPVVAFQKFWAGFMSGDEAQIKPYLKSDRADALTPNDLKLRIYYPPLVEVTDSERGAEGIFKLLLRGTYVHPYDPSTMGSLEAYESRHGPLEIVTETYTDLLQRVPPDFAERLQTFVDEKDTEEIWLLEIPGRALVIKEDGGWRVDIFHFDDRTMRRMAPRRLILPEKAPEPDS